MAQFPPSGFIAPFAGGGNGDQGPALGAKFDPIDMALHNPGHGDDVYVVDQIGLRVRKIDSVSGAISTVIGTGDAGFSGDGGPATAATLTNPTAVEVDQSGAIFLCDGARLRRVGSDGIIETIAGTGTIGYSGDGGPARLAKFGSCKGVWGDVGGDVYLADDFRPSIRRIYQECVGTAEACPWQIVTVAGTGSASVGNSGSSADGGAATSAALVAPVDGTTDETGNIFFVDGAASVVRKVDTSGIITTIAGSYAGGFWGDGGQAAGAFLNGPKRLAFDASGNLLVLDRSNNRVRKIAVVPGSGVVAGSSIITTIVGNGSNGNGGDGGSASAASLQAPDSMGLDGAGRLLIGSRASPPEFTSYKNRVRRVDAQGIIQTVFGLKTNGDGKAALDAAIEPAGLALGSAALPDLYIADRLNHQIRRVNGTTRVVTTLAGNGESGFSGDDGPASSAKLNVPYDVTFDPEDGTIYIADTANQRVRAVSTSGIIRTVAGTGAAGYSGDTGSASSAKLNSPKGVALDADGNLYVADTNNHRVRKVSPTGTITTLAGTGTSGYTGDGGAATQAGLNTPLDVAVAPDGSVYIADSGSNRIRRVAAETITTVVGNGFPGFSGDGGPATAAQIRQPGSLTFDVNGDLFFADLVNKKVRRVDWETGTIDTVAGNGINGVGGDGGPATNANLYGADGVVADANGHLYIAQASSHRVRVVSVPASAPATPTQTWTPLPTNTPTQTWTPLPTNTPTQTWTPLPTNTPTRTWTPQPTNTPTATPTRTFTATPTSTSTATPTKTATKTPSQAPTHTPTWTPIPTSTSTPRSTPAGLVPLDVDANGITNSATDLVYIGRSLLSLSPVPPTFRTLDPSIPPDQEILARIVSLGDALDVDANGVVDAATDVTYISRHLLGLPPVPASFRDLDPSIPPDNAIIARIAVLLLP